MSNYVEDPVVLDIPYQRIQEIAGTPPPDASKTAEAIVAFMILKEKCRPKRERLPELAACELHHKGGKSLLSRVAQAIRLN